MEFPDRFDVIVIGGGHAGTEAALAAARMGSSTLLLTHNIETLGQMSCNPAIGGIGKSHLVKEIDALGGAMARATDRAGIQFRVLNSRKGPAVRATRAQADRVLYKAAIREMLENQPNLTLFQQAADDLIVENDQVVGVVTQTGIRFSAKTVVLTTGTFLGGVIHIGMQHHSGGRAGDAPANALAKRLRELPFNVGRLKTGTPPRIDARTVDFSVMDEQWGDNPAPVMSFMGSRDEHPDQVCCYVTRTTEQTHDIIRSGFDRSPMFAGSIEGVGPRYCPSIEDKVNRFADKDSHQIFVEPEGLNTHELYPNGISTSLPFDIQLAAVRSIPGFEKAHITRPGYAIEYDYLNPQDLRHTLETKFIGGLYFAGQINGTTGYEEAGAQGLLAGLNAALRAQEKEAWYPRRDEAYLGVLVDDLITMGTKEPYRMFTSRAEYRWMSSAGSGSMTSVRPLPPSASAWKQPVSTPAVMPASGPTVSCASPWGVIRHWPSCCAARKLFTTTLPTSVASARRQRMFPPRWKSRSSTRATSPVRKTRSSACAATRTPPCHWTWIIPALAGCPTRLSRSCRTCGRKPSPRPPVSRV